jgi:hypothetical protein
VDAAAVGEVEVGGVGTGEAGAGEDVEVTAVGIDGKTLSEVEVLSGGAGGVGVAGAIDQGVAGNAEGTNLSDRVIGSAGGTIDSSFA